VAHPSETGRPKAGLGGYQMPELRCACSGLPKTVPDYMNWHHREAADEPEPLSCCRVLLTARNGASNTSLEIVPALEDFVESLVISEFTLKIVHNFIHRYVQVMFDHAFKRDRHL
jgi:hypothetical protein